MNHRKTYSYQDKTWIIIWMEPHESCCWVHQMGVRAAPRHPSQRNRSPATARHSPRWVPLSDINREREREWELWRICSTVCTWRKKIICYPLAWKLDIHAWILSNTHPHKLIHHTVNMFTDYKGATAGSAAAHNLVYTFWIIHMCFLSVLATNMSQ